MGDVFDRVRSQPALEDALDKIRQRDKAQEEQNNFGPLAGEDLRHAHNFNNSGSTPSPRTSHALQHGASSGTPTRITSTAALVCPGPRNPSPTRRSRAWVQRGWSRLGLTLE